MKFPSALIVVITLAFATACKTGDIKVTDNKVEVDAAGVRVTVGGGEAEKAKAETERVKAERDALSQQLAALQAQLAEKEKLTSEELKKLAEQAADVSNQLLSLTKKVGSLQRTESDLRDQVEKFQKELAQERAAREEERRARESTEEAEELESYGDDSEPETEEVIWSVAAVKNPTRCAVTFHVLSDAGAWEVQTILPDEEMTFARQGGRVQLRLGYQQWELNSIRVIGGDPGGIQLSENQVASFGWDGRSLTLFR